MKDSFRELSPATDIYSRYYTCPLAGPGASRIDRCYHWGLLSPVMAEYIPMAWSDHMAHIITFSLPSSVSRALSPRARPLFKIKPEVIKDPTFQSWIRDSMVCWKQVKDRGLNIIDWWEIIVKPGITKLAIKRSKEINKDRRGVLNIILLTQSYWANRIHLGNLEAMCELRSTQLQIENWFRVEADKITLQAKGDDCTRSEKVRIYHHELLKKKIKQSVILSLSTDKGIINGHSVCAKYLEDGVANLLLNPHPLDQTAMNILLDEVEPVFSEKDNEMLLARPCEEEIWNVLCHSNLLASPDMDSIPALLYKECWAYLKEPLTEMCVAIHAGDAPTLSQRTSLMIFGTKPKKLNSLKPSDKRRISLLNSDMKIITGIESRRFHMTASHSISPMQLVTGTDHRIHQVQKRLWYPISRLPCWI